MIKCLDCKRPATKYFAATMGGLNLLWPLCSRHAPDLAQYTDPDRQEITKEEYLTAKLKRLI